MYAITVSEAGVLTWAEVDDPVVGPDEVLLDVAASAVNRADLLQVAGIYPPPPGASPYLGLECSGRVTLVGRNVTAWQPGDAVCALLAGGGYAQRVAVRADHCLPLPHGVGLVDAAALPEAACTVWSNVLDVARLEASETLLVHGGGSGIGTFAIQLAVAHGARVITTARAPKHARLRELGAEIVIDYTAADFANTVEEATEGRGVNVILDIVGGAYLEQNVRSLAVGGRMIVIGLQGTPIGKLNTGVLLAKRAGIQATALRPQSATEKARIVRGVLDQVWPLIADRRVQPVIHTRLPLQRAAEAHDLVRSSEHLGKVLLVAPQPY